MPTNEELRLLHEAARIALQRGEPQYSDAVLDYEHAACNELPRLLDEADELKQWVHDLQSGMYINCVYCGHRYGPEKTTPATMADVLKAHVEQCPKHPMSQLRAQLAVKDRRIEALRESMTWKAGVDLFVRLEEALEADDRATKEGANPDAE